MMASRNVARPSPEVRRLHHTSSAEVAEIANKIKRGLLITCHRSNVGEEVASSGRDVLIEQIRSPYKGRGRHQPLLCFLTSVGVLSGGIDHFLVTRRNAIHRAWRSRYTTPNAVSRASPCIPVALVEAIGTSVDVRLPRGAPIDIVTLRTQTESGGAAFHPLRARSRTSRRTRKTKSLV